MNYRKLTRKPLGNLPTPLVELSRLSDYLGGPQLLMKRDDLTGLALGGNKTRKLEFLMADALSRNCDVVVTAGAVQSNHCRQTAAAAAACGLECHIVLGGSPPESTTGNLLLDKILGAHIHYSGEFRKGETIPDIVESLNAEGHSAYVIPYGGSNEIGAAAFVEAMLELDIQLTERNVQVDHIVFPSSSGGTQAGLCIGKYLLAGEFELIGIEVDKSEAGEAPYTEQVLRLINRTADLLEVDGRFSREDVLLRNEYTGGGYGIVGDLERRAIDLTARLEGIFLDPVYSGRAMGALIDLIEHGEFERDDLVLFWHTGGIPALFAYADDVIQQDMS